MKTNSPKKLPHPKIEDNLTRKNEDSPNQKWRWPQPKHEDDLAKSNRSSSILGQVVLIFLVRLSLILISVTKWCVWDIDTIKAEF